MITYMTLPGDTLEKIAADLKVENPAYLKEFHNTYCALHNRLAEPVQLKPGTLLHIPFGNEISILNQKISDNGDSLYYHPPQGKIAYPIPLLGGIYTVRQLKYQDGRQQASYQYQTELKYLRAEKDDHFFSLQIFGSRKNGEESDSKISSLAKACAAILFPVEIRVSSAAQLKDVKFYHPESTIKNELEALKRYFTDDISASYIDQMKKKTEDKGHMLTSIRHMLPVQFLFGAFYRAKYDGWTDSGVYHEFIPWLTHASPIRFELYNRILPKEQNETDEPLKIIQSGKSCDYRNLNQLYDKSYPYQEQTSFNSRSVSCSHEAEYIFDRTDLVIRKITGSFEIRIGDVTEKDVLMMEKE
ncbi:hypothetical protein ACQ7CX_19740 [Chryseobacterium arthrosphaerae]|uniref:hypothetical protein n=1 Tax=Chryseobacterium arthrosphaerae TaxID=651561 RepID=UPI001BAF4521|nr:hypothetical protein [Chryseobacterium arthrosphaerae]QUY56020.1 hypothetical protein I2F65_01230 [Chryseobacterium arthrosphaerae]